MRCAMIRREYQILGYKGKQVRDNIHSYDLVNAFYHFYENPRCGEVYNIGGSRFSHCSLLESVQMCEKITGNKMKISYVEANRRADNIWWVSDVSKFSGHYPSWELTRNSEDILTELFTYNHSRWV